MPIRASTNKTPKPNQADLFMALLLEANKNTNNTPRKASKNPAKNPIRLKPPSVLANCRLL